MTAHTDCAYAAGLIDGEGCIGIYHNSVSQQYQLRVQVEMVSRGGTKLLAKRWGGRWYYKHRAAPRRPVHTWMIFGSRAAEMLRDIVPYMRVKHQQARAALRCEWLPRNGKRLATGQHHRRDIAAARLRVLNRRGIK